MADLLVDAREEEESEEVWPAIAVEDEAWARTESLMAMNKFTEEKLKKMIKKKSGKKEIKIPVLIPYWVNWNLL